MPLNTDKSLISRNQSTQNRGHFHCKFLTCQMGSLMSSRSYTQGGSWHLGKYMTLLMLFPASKSLLHLLCLLAISWHTRLTYSEKPCLCISFSTSAAPLPDCGWIPLLLCIARLDLTDSSLRTEALSLSAELAPGKVPHVWVTTSSVARWEGPNPKGH